MKLNPSVAHVFGVTESVIPYIEERIAGLSPRDPSALLEGLVQDKPLRQYVAQTEADLALLRCRDVIWVKQPAIKGEPDYLQISDEAEFISIGREPEKGDWSIERCIFHPVWGCKRMSIGYGTEQQVKQVLIQMMY